MFINCDGYWITILIDAVETYNNNKKKHSATKMTRVYASHNPEKIKYYHTGSKLNQYLKFSDFVRNADKKLYLYKLIYI